jgi:5-methylcytosine-specific restriction endonuclease McrA
MAANLRNRDPHDWYGDTQYRKRRAHQLRCQPLCELCLAAGKIKPATVTHHIVPHRGDVNSFRTGALQSLCKRCHDGLSESGKPRPKQKRIILLDGYPII